MFKSNIIYGLDKSTVSLGLIQTVPLEADYIYLNYVIIRQIKQNFKRL